MPAPPDLLEAIDQLGGSLWSGELYRHTAPDRDPLSGTGARMFGGRWNPSGSFPTIYLAEPLDACLAEFLRMARGQARGADSFRSRQLHLVEAHELELVDLTADSALGHLGLSSTDLASDDWSPCQRVGEGIYFLGYQGLRAMSATELGTVVGVFEARLGPGQLTVIETKPMASYI